MTIHHVNEIREENKSQTPPGILLSMVHLQKLTTVLGNEIKCMKEVLYEVRCLKSTEDMILALVGQFKQLSHEPEKFRWLNGIRTHDLFDAGAVL